MCVDMDTGTSFAIKIFKKSLLKRRQSRFQGTAFDDVRPAQPRPRAHSPRPYGPAATTPPPCPAAHGPALMPRQPVGDTCFATSPLATCHLATSPPR